MLNDYEMQHNAEVGLFTKPSKILLTAIELVLVMSQTDQKYFILHGYG